MSRRTFFWDGSDDCMHCLCNLPHTFEEHAQELDRVLSELQEQREDLQRTCVTHDLWEEPEEERNECESRIPQRLQAESGEEADGANRPHHQAPA